jgi:F420-dependent oxidoreductase-like protein
MRIGLQVPNFNFAGGTAAIRDQLKAIAQTADSGGLYSLWVMDHFFQIQGVGTPEMFMLEGYTTLSYFAAVTQKVKLGTMVTGVVYRYPGILVKTVNTLDVLSGGRAYMGIGAAWFEREAKGLGVPFPALKARFEMLEETLQIAHQMWSGEVKPFEGKHFQLAETLSSPQPISQPHPPILIGGGGEKKTLSFVARYADAWNFFLRAPKEDLEKKVGILKGYCEQYGRDYNSIEKTTLSTIMPTASAADVIKDIEYAKQLGFEHVIYNIANTDGIVSTLEMLAHDVIPQVNTL